MCLALVACLVGGCGPQQPDRNRVTIGAIRWDAWHVPAAGEAHGGDGGPVRAMEASLNPKRYRHRAPFFARVDTNDVLRIDGYTQAIVDREIAFARAGGIDYWAFLLYDEDNVMSQGLALYLKSGRRRDVNFCAIASPGTFGPGAQWPEGIARIVRLMREPGYQTVCGGRPLLYVFRVDDKWIKAWGGPEGARRLFDGLRSASREAGLGDPYMVTMQDGSAAEGKRMADAIGAEALSDYARSRGEAGAPYSRLVEVAREFWEECAATGSGVVPLAMAGWDRRPRVEHPVPWEPYQKPGVGLDKFYIAPTPEELAAHIGEAMEWAELRPAQCPAKTVIVYAWNEHDEGGWLCPDLGNGDARLRAIRKMTESRRRSRASGGGH
ncbi:MAG: hypothetical protein IT577_07070 [Verrucomicrobiae bacterium]|nr:hypothetical protein [Verrucomicrobiae bacterium]